MGANYEESIKNMNEKFSSIRSYEKSVIDAIYQDLNSNIKSANVVGKAISEGIDHFISSNRVKISSLDDIFAFERIGSSTLVHKSTKDLWAIEADTEGVHITRLFDNNGEPLKI